MKKIVLCLFLILSLMCSSTVIFALETPTIDSEAGLLIDSNSGKILFEKNADKKMYPASTTKLLTAILVVENCSLDESATASEKAIMSVPAGYTIANIQVGETFTVDQLLHVMLICSANDAANVLAEHVGGSIEDFAKMLNQKAEELGCTRYSFYKCKWST